MLFFQQVVEKKKPEERVGVVVKCDGKYQVLYTDKETFIIPCIWIVFTNPQLHVHVISKVQVFTCIQCTCIYMYAQCTVEPR